MSILRPEPKREGRLRVVQWTTGIVGRSALRAILDDARLELVGVYAHSSDKVGVDAGTIVGHAPVGVVATNDVDALLGLGADCVVYMPHWPDIEVLERILRSGSNVVTTARLVNGEHYPDGAGQRLREAALAGGVTLVGTGMNPMFVPTVALAATAMCREVRRISVLESLDCVMYGSAGTWEAYGFGGPADPELVRDALLRTEPDYSEALGSLARGIGVEIDSVELDVDVAVALADRDLGFMAIPAGSMAGLDARWRGLAAGESVAEFRMVWKLGSIFGYSQDPEWEILHGYRIRIDGDPNVNLRLSFAPDDFASFDIGTTTAMPAVNAIPAIVAAAPGVLGTADLPLVTSRHRSIRRSPGSRSIRIEDGRSRRARD
jgi:2,4-diaminopentanoate dehydrogenase